MNNFLLESEIRRSASGNLIRETNYTYDENGNLTNINVPLRNLSGSGSTFTYDENNNLIRRRDSSISNTFTSSTTTNYTYDDFGRVLTKSGFTNNSFSGNIQGEYITNYSYDDRNNLVLQSVDRNRDGTIDTEIEFTYDDNNNLLTQTNNSPNNDTSILVKSYTYDENNNLIKESKDTNLNGTFNFTIDYEYDENNNLITQATDFDLDGIPEEIVTNAYDENNNLVTVEFESTLDFKTDSITTNTYDRFNNLITSSLDLEQDGVIDEITENSYIRFGEIDESSLSLTEVHRFYHSELGFHLYSADNNEIDSVRARSDAGELAYAYEAEQYRVLEDNLDAFTGEIIEDAKPVYRFFNAETGAHLYTTDEVEKNAIEDNLTNYNFEGIQYYAFESEPEDFETIPVYRLFNNISGSHLYSSDTNELDYIEQNLPHFAIENNGDAVFYVFEL